MPKHTQKKKEICVFCKIKKKKQTNKKYRYVCCFHWLFDSVNTN